MDNSNLQNNILEKIRTGELSMRPKFFFTFRLVLAVLISILILVISSFLVSFILFGIMASGKAFLLGFGFRGLSIFLITFPWFVLCIEIVLIIVLRQLIKRFQFGYRSPLAYMLAGIFALSVLIGVIINTTSIHRILAHREERQELPVIGMFYHHIRRPPSEYGAFRGTVVSIGTSTFVLQTDEIDATPDDQTRTIVLPQGVPLPPAIVIGESIFVVGDASGTQIQAFGIRELATSTDQY